MWVTHSPPPSGRGLPHSHTRTRRRRAYCPLASGCDGCEWLSAPLRCGCPPGVSRRRGSPHRRTRTQVRGASRCHGPPAAPAIRRLPCGDVSHRQTRQSTDKTCLSPTAVGEPTTTTRVLWAFHAVASTWHLIARAQATCAQKVCRCSGFKLRLHQSPRLACREEPVGARSSPRPLGSWGLVSARWVGGPLFKN